GLAVVAALDGVDDDVPRRGQLAGVRILDVVGIIHVRRGIADQEDDLQGLLRLAPGNLGDRFVKGLVDALGKIAAPLGLETHELRVNGVQVIGQIDDLGDVGVATVPVGDQADLDARGRAAAGDLVGDGPDLLLGRVDQPRHAAGGVEAKDNFHVGPGR